MQSRFKTSLGQPNEGSAETEATSNSESQKTSQAAVKPYARPKNIGRYKVIDELGRGAMAYVYKAYDPEIDRFLAVKVLREELANDNDYRGGFIHEAKLAGQLAHPGIVTVYDVGVADDKPYIAMELLDGIPLDELLKKRGRLSLHFVISIMVQLTRALHYAHKQGVTHRDIKPGNIICLADNKTVKLTDFGIAQLDDSLASAGKTQEKVLGTPEYMAPEQVLGHKLDARSDLYSLGTLVYTMVTGSTPFHADDYGELFRQIIKDKPADMSVEGIAIPDELQDIVRKLLSKQPDKRYQSSAELMRDIRELLDVLESSAKEQARPGFVSLRLRWTLGMAGLVSLTMLIGLVVVYFQQFASMRSLATDYGYSTTRLIAFEVAEPVLLNDATALEAIVNDLRNNQDIEYINIRDQKNVVIASTLSSEVGKVFSGFKESELLDETSNASIYTRDVNADHKVLDIDSAITYQSKQVGRVMITVSADKLVQSTKLTLLIMIILMIVTLLAVFFMTLAFARQISAQSARLALALERMRRGQFNRRLTVERNDEFGRVSIAFNQMAESLEKRFEKKSPRISGDTEKLLVTKPDGQEAKATDDDVSTVILEKKLKG
ncbi:protein kinase domain-containing protein [Pleionea litopenaei]|uniref:non-specific serine/threonine protein kinase n=1 Tax=Pleionea litopenaei TaxID=3070815 RepID=A0AA51RST3_9GAMM|nr:protein kinase [Pleionea sp. HL-JVS1]WMS86848.1 protein kinase [Pleionea sp. HL-JVS1]